MAGAALLACHPQLFRVVVPADQYFDKDKGYAGITNTFALIEFSRF